MRDIKIQPVASKLKLGLVVGLLGPGLRVKDRVSVRVYIVFRVMAKFLLSIQRRGMVCVILHIKLKKPCC